MNDTNSTPSKTTTKPLYPFVLIALALFVGLILSFISGLGLCSETCGEAHNYRFYGYPFEPFGWVFFSTALTLHFLSLKYPSITFYVSLLLGAGVGAEIIFVLIQKYQIGHWCPVCLSIAACVSLAALISFIQYFIHLDHQIKQHNKEQIMKNLQRGFATLIIMISASILAAFGVAKPDQSFASTNNSANESPLFGNTKSDVEIYFVTDWFCSACQQIEPQLAKIYPSIMKKATLVFVDKAIHPETMNYVPYNLALMLRHKDKYFEIRKVLHELAQQTKAPTEAQVQAAVKRLGITYVPLNYSDIDSGIKFFEGISKTFKIDSTPTLIVANRKNLKSKKLVGGKEITEAHINAAIDEVSEKS